MNIVKSRSNIIYLLPGIDGELHSVNASDIEKLITAKGGQDSCVVRNSSDWLVLAMPAGTIRRYFDVKKWKNKIE